MCWEESVFWLIHVVGRNQFLAIVGLISCFPQLSAKASFQLLEITHSMAWLLLFPDAKPALWLEFYSSFKFLLPLPLPHGYWWLLSLLRAYGIHWASLLAQMVKNLPAVQETGVRSLGREDPLEKGMATHSSILAWRIPWTEALVGYSSYCLLGLSRYSSIISLFKGP